MDPVHELQGAIIARLKATSSVTAIVGTRVYDIPPAASATYPYISIGPTNYFSDDVDCIYGGEVMVQIDAVSTTNNYSQMRAMADAIRRALRDWEPTITTNAVVSFEHQRTDYIRVEGAINHASIRYTAIIEEP